MTIRAFVFVCAVLGAMATFAAGTPGVIRDKNGKIARDPKVVAAFRKAYPPPPWCRTDGKYDGKKCEIDHAIPLCAGGPDAVWNLQYQRRSDANEKDKLEAEICRRLTKCEVPR